MSTKRILVVDDDPRVTRNLKLDLETGRGFDVFADTFESDAHTRAGKAVGICAGPGFGNNTREECVLSGKPARVPQKPSQSVQFNTSFPSAPIMMTTMAALLGALPLALEQGNGSELRRPLGISIVGGLLLSQFLTLYTAPVIYLYLDRLATRMRRWRVTNVDSEELAAGASSALAQQSPDPP